MSRKPLFAAALVALAWSSTASAGPLDPWGAEVGAGVFALTPFVFVDQTPGVYPLIYGQYGFTDKLELLVGAGATVVPSFSFDSVEVMPRYFFTDTTAVALHATWAPGDPGVTVAPEWHGIYPAGPLTVTINAGWGPYFGASGFAAGSVYAYVAPEYFITEATSVFVEVNPAYDLTNYGDVATDRFSLEVVPGVSTAIADTHYFALGVGIPLTGFDPKGIYAGLWYSISFGGGGDDGGDAPAGVEGGVQGGTPEGGPGSAPGSAPGNAPGGAPGMSPFRGR